MGDLEIGHADRARGLGLELLERLPGRDVVTVVQGRQRPVDQEQVDVLEAERVERPLEGAAGVVGLVVAVVQLARDVQLRAVQPGRADRLPPPPRCRTSRRCRCGGSRRAGPRPPPRRSRRGRSERRPKPSCGIVLPSFSGVVGRRSWSPAYPGGRLRSRPPTIGAWTSATASRRTGASGSPSADVTCDPSRAHRPAACRPGWPRPTATARRAVAARSRDGQLQARERAPLELAP